MKVLGLGLVEYNCLGLTDCCSQSMFGLLSLLRFVLNSISSYRLRYKGLLLFVVVEAIQVGCNGLDLSVFQVGYIGLALLVV